MKEQISKMVAGGICSIKLTIQHMGQRSYRMVIIGMNTRKCPDNIFQRQAGGYMAIIKNVVTIIEAYELIMNYRFKSNKSYYSQQYINQMNVIFVRNFTHNTKIYPV